MTDCGEIGLMLGPFEDGELEPHEMQEVARHLAVCAGCEKLLSGYSLIGRELRALAVAPPLEGFAEAVQGRIEKLRLPWRVRLAQALERTGGGMGAAVALGSFAAAAVLTAFLVTPWARQHFAREPAGGSLAGMERNVAERNRRLAETADFAAVDEGSRTVISRLESRIPSVAVWSEPREGATVIWLPDQDQ